MTIIPDMNLNTPEDTEKWLERMGSKFIEVRLHTPKATLQWLDERHIDDPDTVVTTITMSLERLGGRYAVWHRPDSETDQGNHWRLLDRHTGAVRAYPSQEAAEMVAMHRRG